MPTFGGYETAAELSTSGLITVYSARPAGSSDAPAFAIKVCQPSEDVLGPAAAAIAREAFLSRAGTQDRIAKALASTAHGKNFARVHAMGTDAETRAAFLVTDLADKGTLQKLGSGRVNLDRNIMARLVADVVDALGELDRALGRGHGELKPSDVLLSAAGAGGALADLSRARVILADPLSDVNANPDRDRLSDLRAVGAIIHLLVLHTPFRGGWPLAPTAEWNALGPNSPRWLELVNKLLDPDDAAPRPTIAELAAIIAELRARKRSKTPVIAAIVAALLIGGGTAAYFATREAKPEVKYTLWNASTEERWIELCNAYRGWYSLFRAGLAKRPGEGIVIPAPTTSGAPQPTRQDAYVALDPHLANLVALPGAGVGFDPWSIAKGSTQGVKPERDLNDLARDPGMYARADWGVERTEQALGAIDALRKGLTEWEAPKALGAKGETYAERTWTAGGSYLKQLDGSTDPDKAADIVAAVDAVLAAEREAAKIDGSWQRVVDATPAIAASREPVLTTFTPESAAAMIAKSQASTVGRRDDLASLVVRTEEVAKLAERLKTFAERDLPGVDLDAFENSPAYAQLKAAGPSVETFETYIAESAKHPNLDPTLDPRRGVDFAALVKNVHARAQRLAARPLNVSLDSDLSSRVEKAQPDAAALDPHALRWNRRNQPKIDAETARLKTELESLARALDAKIAARLAEIAAAAKAVRDELGARATVVNDSDAINAAWVRWRDKLLATHAEDEQYETLRDRSNALASALKTATEATIPPPLTPKNAASPVEAQLKLASATERERAIGDLLGSMPEPPADVKDLNAETTVVGLEFAKANAKLLTLRDQLSSVEDMLAQGAVPGSGADGQALDAAWTTASQSPITKLEGVRPALAGLESRLTEVKAISAETDQAKLLTVIEGSGPDRPERPLAAWSRLSGWPSSSANLAQAKSVRTKLNAALSGLSEARRTELSQRITTDFKSRWTGYATRQTDPRQLEAALDARADFAVADADLPPSLRYNLLVRDLRSTTRDKTMTDDAVRPLVESFLTKARAIRAEGSGAGTINRITSSLAPMGLADQPREVEIDPRTLGPGKVWGVGAGSVEGNLLVFRKGNLRLEFMRVETSADPVFLCTRELSIGDAMEIAQGAIRTQLKQADAGSAAWTGPRGWIYSARDEITPGTWLKNDPIFTPELPAFAPSILAPGQVSRVNDASGGEPTRDSPLQSISPIALGVLARAVGCRFPTADEWQSAYRVSGGGIPAGANLRDQTWQTQHSYVVATQPKVIRKDPYQWPDAGAFAPDSGGPPTGQGATARTGADGVLWFAPVASGPGPIHHLVGNVAELTFADGYKMETTPATSDAVGRMFDGAAETALGIIGGSALSAPQLPIDRPLTVDTLSIEEGYADMGARLAFNGKGTRPPRQPLALQVQNVLTDEAYVLGK